MAPIPGRKWPMIWIGCALYLIVCAIDELEYMPFAFVLLALACWHYARRIKARQQWREQREFEWLMNMPELPPATDWVAFERNALRRRVVIEPQTGERRV